MTTPLSGSTVPFASAPFSVEARETNPFAKTPESGSTVPFASAPISVEARETNPFAKTPVYGALVPFATAPISVRAETFEDVIYDPLTGRIIVKIPPFFGVEAISDTFVIVGDQVGGGWLPKHKRKEITSTKAAKIKAKRERRQEYVMRKIYNELKGIDFADDPELMALMAEFETPDEVLKSAEEIQAMLNDAYMKYIVERELRIAEQDKKDEEEIMALLALTL